MQIQNQNVKAARRGGQALIGVLVVLAITIAAAGFYLSAKGKNPDGSESTHTALRRSIDLAQEVVLQSNLNQVALFMSSYKPDNDGKPPATFDELKKQMRVPADFWINPVDKKPLDYNPATGLMIVQPYEGMSRQITQMTTAPAPDAAGSTPGASPPAASAPSTPGAPGMPNIPTIPNSGAAPPAATDE